jgi:Zn-dependent protease
MTDVAAGNCPLAYGSGELGDAETTTITQLSTTPVTVSSDTEQNVGVRRAGGDHSSSKRGGILAVLAVLVKVSKFSFMALAVASYIWIFGPLFGVGIIGLIYVHEMGHVIALKRKGIAATLPILLPFFGALVRMKEAPKSAFDEAYVGIAGPVVGGAGALFVFVAAEFTGSHFLMALAYVGFLINLFNLLPMLPLDGGRVMAAIHPAVWIFGLVGLVGLFCVTLAPFYLIIALLGLIEAWGRHASHKAGKTPGYYSVPKPKRVAMALAYFGLVIALSAGMATSYLAKSQITHTTTRVNATWSKSAKATAKSCKANANGRAWTLSFNVATHAPYVVTGATCSYSK